MPLAPVAGSATIVDALRWVTPALADAVRDGWIGRPGDVKKGSAVKLVAIAVAILLLAVLVVLQTLTTRALVEQSAAQAARMAGLSADFDILAKQVERISDGLSQEIASNRRGSREDLQSVQGRVLLSLSAVEQRLGRVSAEQDRLGEPAGPEKGRGLVHGALEPEIELWSDGCGVRLYG